MVERVVAQTAATHCGLALGSPLKASSVFPGSYSGPHGAFVVLLREECADRAHDGVLVEDRRDPGE
jgi:hypothetical protein